MKKILAGLLLMVLILAGCSGSKEEKEKQAKTDRIIMEQVQKAVEKTEKIEQVTWSADASDYGIEKIEDLKEIETGKVYKNIYATSGIFEWEGKNYRFDVIVAINDEELLSDRKVIFLTTDLGGYLEVPVEPV
ncbi:putative periplasmic lipoprotein [Isobaculum melis]|uniref:Uncharacterized protein n=1 Tax=Isobaculum melis TaxID=142588 RepID=A0A1H9PXT5_9LACT|nr:hypothetical protein [Isobaculum melis]SER53106.1 hypothetical protein SAMN04488559_101226 [Isobaculum melis]